MTEPAKHKPAILVVTELFPATSSDFIGTFVFEQLRRLTQHFTVVVLTTHTAWDPKNPTRRIPTYRTIQGIDVYSVSYYPWWITILEVFHIKNKHECFAMNKRYVAPKIRRFAESLHRRYRFSLVHGHEIYIGDEAVPIAAELGIPSVFTLHGIYEYHCKSFGKGLIDTAIVPNLQQADAVIAVSNVAAHSYTTNGLNRDDIHIIPNGISPEENPKASQTIKKKTPRSVVLLTVGFLVPEKRTERAIRALSAAVRAGFHDVQLVIIGRGMLLGHLRTITAELKMADHVQFLSNIPSAEMPSVYAASDVLIHPSIVESFSMVCLEAMAYGKPIICTDAIGLAEYLHPETDAVIVHPDNQQELDSAVCRLVGSASERERIGRAARDTARKFSWDSIIPEILSVYNKLAPQ